MTFNLQENLSTPVLESLTLKVDGERVATAAPMDGSTIGRWRVTFHGADVIVGTPTEDRARDFLAWLGEKLSPLNELAGPEDLDRATVGSLWQSEYPAKPYGGSTRNQYLLLEDGWQWRSSSERHWNSCGDGPFALAYPLRPVSE
jgi:hypothetical protein